MFSSTFHRILIQDKFLFVTFLLAFQLSINSQVFSTLEKVDHAYMVDSASAIFGKSILKMEFSQAEKELNFLMEFAIKNNHKDLEVVSYALKGSYYVLRTSDKRKEGISLLKAGLKLSDDYNLKIRSAKMTSGIGSALLVLNDYPAAFEYLLKGEKLMRDIGFENIPKIASYLTDIGNAYFSFSNYDRALAYFKDAMHYADIKEKRFLYNDIGLVYLEINQLDSALYYFENALELFIEHKDSSGIGVISGNVGTVYLKKKNYSKAKPLLEKDFDLSMKRSAYQSAFTAAILLTEIALAEKNMPLAYEYLQESFKLITKKPDNVVSNKTKYYKMLSNYYFLKGDYKVAYTYLDSFSINNDSLSRAKDMSMVSNLESHLMTERHLSEINILEREKKTSILIRNIIIVSSILVSLFFLLFIYNLRMKSAKAKKLFEVEKQRAEEKLKNSGRMLHSYLSNLKEKNKLIEQFGQELDLLKSGTTIEIANDRNEAIETLKSSSILTEEDWIKFRRLFDDVHVGFFQRLHDKFPDLTLAETRLLALTKLDLSSKEIASITGISPESVRRTSQRLRKKLSIEGGHFELLELVQEI